MRGAGRGVLAACAFVATVATAHAHAYRIVTSFGASASDGAIPYAGVVRAPDGNWYGTTADGGTVYKHGYCSLGCGTVYRMHGAGTRTAIHDFSGPDGEVPVGALLAARGWLYGTTTATGRDGGGTVFRLHSDGSAFRTLHHFNSRQALGGADPQGALIQDGSGRLYGITVGGLGPASPDDGEQPQFAIAYRMESDGGDFRLLHSFALDDHGGVPTDGLILAGDGRLYGTTGRSTGRVVQKVFGMNQDGSAYRELRVFKGATTTYQSPGVIEALPGRLFGVTATNGASGTIFSVALDGSGFRIVHRFQGHDGAAPLARLTAMRTPWSRTGVTLYGTASRGGRYGLGTFFEVDPSGADFTVLHHFRGFPVDGAVPLGAPAPSGDGVLMGTTQQGGANTCSPFSGCGTVYAWDATPSVVGRFLRR